MFEGVLWHLWQTILLIGVCLVIALAYWIRVIKFGRPHFDRVEKQGGSSLLGLRPMEIGYFAMVPMGAFFARLGFTPNSLSWSSLVFGAFCAGSLAVGDFGLAAVFSTISSLLDSLDGMVARSTGLASDAGEILDASIDRYVEFLFLGGILIYYRDNIWLMMLALAALSGAFMVSYSTAKAEALGISPPKGNMRRPERAVYLTLGAALSPLAIYFFEGADISGQKPYAYPMIAALSLVAVFGNWSAIYRLRAIAMEIRKKESRIRESSREVMKDPVIPMEAPLAMTQALPKKKPVCKSLMS